MATACTVLTVLLIDCFVFDILCRTIWMGIAKKISCKSPLSAIIQFDFKWNFHPSQWVYNRNDVKRSLAREHIHVKLAGISTDTAHKRIGAIIWSIRFTSSDCVVSTHHLLRHLVRPMWLAAALIKLYRCHADWPHRANQFAIEFVAIQCRFL